METDKFYLLINIDGLRNDVFQAALEQNKIPNIAKLLHGLPENNSINIPLSSTAPSITFSAQASIFTGKHPQQHGIPGNQYFDRFGTNNQGIPRFYTFDVGDQLGFLDAIQVFTDGLADNLLQTETLYESLSKKGMRSIVAGNMYSRGADWIKPTLIDLARLTKMPKPFKLTPPDYDSKLLKETLEHIRTHGFPSLLTYYLKGLDEHSHRNGPDSQLDYLSNVADPEIGKLWGNLVMLNSKVETNTVALIFSDHGQIATIPDDQHSIRLAFPFDKEMAPLFENLGLDVHDYPGEGPNCNAVVAMNGGLAYVYLRNRELSWAEKPLFDRDVLPVAKAFWREAKVGKTTPNLKNSLSAVLLKNVERDSWGGPYQALTVDGRLISLEDWFNYEHPQKVLDPINRVQYLNSRFTGDILLLSNYSDGYYFSPPMLGTHGGLHQEDSEVFLVAYWPNGDKANKGKILEQIETRCREENNRKPSIVDIQQVLFALMEGDFDN